MKPHSVCSRFALTPMVHRLYVSGQAHRGNANPSSNRKTHVFCVPAGPPEKTLSWPLHSRIRLFCLRPAHVVLIGPLQWRLLRLDGGSLRWRGPEIKIFSVFDSTSSPVGRPSRVGRALGALILKPGLE